jgi:O-glycosyl hydrolase
MDKVSTANCPHGRRITLCRDIFKGHKEKDMPKIHKLYLALIATASLGYAAGVSITPTTTHQTIDGFGGGAVYYTGWVTAHPQSQAIYDTMFTGLGLSYLRLGNWNQDTTASLSADSAIVAEGRKRLGSRFKILMTSWGAPAHLKASGSVKGSPNGTLLSPSQNTLKKVNGNYVYAEFANWWKRSLKRYATKGIVPQVISLQNEPDMNASYEETLFAATQNDTIAGYPQALKAVHDTLATLASRPQIYGPEVLGIGYGNFQKYANAMDRSLVDGYNYHLYHGNDGSAYTNPDGFNTILTTLTSTYTGKPWMMSEYCPMRSTHPATDMLYLAQLMTNLLTKGNVSSYINWELLWGDGGQMVQINNPWTTKTWSVNPEYHAMRHFSRFTGPGWLRVAASSDDANVRVVAFRSADGDSLTLVATNIASTQKSLSFSASGYAQVIDAWQSAVAGPMSSRLSLAGTATSLTLPAQSITTLVFKPSSIQSSSSSAPLSSSSSSLANSSSSSTRASSSSVAASSSSTLKACIPFVNGVGGYGSNCYKSGLANMAASTCYTMNPARGTSPSWINNNANDTWWWAIASCSGIQAKEIAVTPLVAPSYYEVFDLQGKLLLKSNQVPQNLPQGRWTLVGRSTSGQILEMRAIVSR